jgi:hypothetical protein
VDAEDVRDLQHGALRAVLAYNWLLVSRLCGSQDASDVREPAKQDESLRKMAAIGLSTMTI